MKSSARASHHEWTTSLFSERTVNKTVRTLPAVCSGDCSVGRIKCVARIVHWSPRRTARAALYTIELRTEHLAKQPQPISKLLHSCLK